MHLAPSNLIGTWIALGLAFGSFVTVLVARVPGRQGLVSFSQCPTCNHPLAAKDNIPVIGFLILRGKCRYCKAKISLRYPLIELITAICVMMPVLKFDGWWIVLAWVTFIVLGIALAVIDFEHHRLPDRLTVPLFLISLFLLAGDAIANHHLHRLKIALISAIALSFFYLFVNVASRGGMGMGDVKLALSIGLLTGYASMAAVLAASFGAFLLGSVGGIAMLFLGGATRKTAVPFGPFMIIGTFLTPWTTQYVVSILNLGH